MKALVIDYYIAHQIRKLSKRVFEGKRFEGLLWRTGGWGPYMVVLTKFTSLLVLYALMFLDVDVILKTLLCTSTVLIFCFISSLFTTGSFVCCIHLNVMQMFIKKQIM